MMHVIPSAERSVEIADLMVQGQGGFHLSVPKLELDTGSMVVLVGRNGSGKSTFLDALLNLLQIDRGTVRIFGEQLAQLSPDHPLRTRVGAQVQGINWAWSIKVGEIIGIHSSLYGHTDPEVLKALGIPALMPLMYRKLSTGQRRRVDLAVALAHRPDLLVLDEPSAGLDRQFEVGFRTILRQQSDAGATLILATHDGQDVGMADRILWFDNGTIVEDSHPDAILRREIGSFVGVVDCDSENLGARIERDLAGIYRSSHRDGTSLNFFGEADLREPFIASMERHSVPGYVVRPSQSSDLLDLIRRRGGEGAGS
jgi:ABC-2 type transport system ATP-binding protein